MDMTVFFTRYRPYIAIVLAVVALIWFLPGGADQGDLAASGGPVVTAPDGSVISGGPDGADPGALTDDGTFAGGGAGTGGAGAGRSGVTGGTGGPIAPPAGGVGADCDPATGRIKVPTLHAPPCVTPFSGDNGGATYQGVTKDTITVTYFQPQVNAATDAALTAAGANDTPADRAETMRAYVDYFNKHYATYGRQVKLIVRRGSGAPADDAVARADALAIATEDKAFAVLDAPESVAFAETLAARGVLCVCTTSQPQELYQRLAPYVGYTTLMSSTQGYIHRAEYIGKRLNGRAAVHAGTSDGVPLSTQPRKFGLLWYNRPDNSYAAGISFFVKELKNRYGVTLAENLEFSNDYAKVSETARPLIQRLKTAGVTSVVFAGDPISPAIFTQEATRQAYFPEWIITGSALTDTVLFARTYDQQQWNKGFGLAFLSARIPDVDTAPYRIHVWHTGAPPKAGNQYGVIYPLPFSLFTGIHLAGPNLTVKTWQAGLFSYPVTGAGFKTIATTSYGNHGIWPFTDYTNLDDVAEIWWDPQEPGPDEVGNNGIGMYRWVNGGARILPGQHPTSDPKAFDKTGTVTIYTKSPPGEEQPTYAHKAH
ncbi:MAG: hypothetical protein ACT452_20505 [Microthrixaceae bacterium]